jgi:hypothetical protein
MLYPVTSDDHNHRSMSSLRKLAALLLVCAVASAADKPRTPPPVKPAAQYPMKVTIAADPCDDQDQCTFFRLPYTSHGFVAVRVIITNDRDEAINLDECVMQFLPAEGDKEGAATDEDLNRRLFAQKSINRPHIPFINTSPEPIDKKILNDDADFGFASTIVPPHSTRAGYIFYDTKGIDDPVLKGAELYIKKVFYNDARGSKHGLFAFQLPFDKWLGAQHQPLPKPSTDKDTDKPADKTPPPV